MNQKKKYIIGWWTICVLHGAFSSAIGHQVTTWQYWVSCALLIAGGWCCFNMGIND